MSQLSSNTQEQIIADAAERIADEMNDLLEQRLTPVLVALAQEYGVDANNLSSAECASLRDEIRAEVEDIT